MINTRTCINQEPEKGRKEEVERDLFLSKKVSLKRRHAGRDVRGCEGCVKAPWEKPLPDGGSSHAQRVQADLRNTRGLWLHVKLRRKPCSYTRRAWKKIPSVVFFPPEACSKTMEAFKWRSHKTRVFDDLWLSSCYLANTLRRWSCKTSGL